MAEKRTRTTKTPRQRAEEAVAVLEKRHARLMKQRKVVEDAVTAYDPAIREVEAELAHARSHPALPREQVPVVLAKPVDLDES